MESLEFMSKRDEEKKKREGEKIYTYKNNNKMNHIYRSREEKEVTS